MEDDINTAIRKGYFQQVRVLAHLGYDVNVRDTAGRTPLINCALVDDDDWGVGLARTVLEYGARPGLRDRLGMTALHYACIHRRLRLVGVLLSAGPDFDIVAGDRRGNTALHYAAANGDRAVVSVLLATCRRYGQPVDRTNNVGRTALEFAVRQEHDDCASLIRNVGDGTTSWHGSNINCCDISQRTITSVPQRTSLTNGYGATYDNLRHGTTWPQLGGSQQQPLANSNKYGRAPTDSITFITDRRQPDDNHDNRINSGSDQFCRTAVAANTSTAISIRQLRAERRPRDIVRDQLLALQTVRPQLAVRASRRMLRDGPGRCGGGYGESLLLRRSSDNIQNGVDKASAAADDDDHEIIPRAALCTRVFRSAPPDDPHNQPLGKFFQTTALQFFSDTATDAVVASKPSSLCRLVVPAEIDRVRPSTAGKVEQSDWRTKMTQLYTAYDYQFTASYRPLAVCPPSARSDDAEGHENVIGSGTGGGGLIRARNSSASEAGQTSGRRATRKASGIKFNSDGSVVIDSGTGVVCKKSSSGQMQTSTASAAPPMAAAVMRMKRMSSNGAAPATFVAAAPGADIAGGDMSTIAQQRRTSNSAQGSRRRQLENGGPSVGGGGRGTRRSADIGREREGRG